MSKKTRVAKSPEELIALASDNGVTMSEEEAREQFAHIGGGALSDDELDNVSGGYGSQMDWEKRNVKVGDTVTMWDDGYIECWECGATQWKITRIVYDWNVENTEMVCAVCGGSHCWQWGLVVEKV